MTDAERMVELLRYANRAAVGRALRVSTQTANEWAKGRDVTPYRLRQVEDLLRPQTAEQVPAWARRLLEGVLALERQGGVSEDELASAQARAAAFLAGVPPTRPPRADGGDGGAAAA